MKTENYTVENIEKIISEFELPSGELFEANKHCWTETKVLNCELTTTKINTDLFVNKTKKRTPKLYIKYSPKRGQFYVSKKAIEKFIDKCNLFFEDF